MYRLYANCVNKMLQIYENYFLNFSVHWEFWKGKQATTKCIKGDPRVPQKVISSLHHQVNFLGRNHVKD
jgi:hypothetical protein